LFRLLLSLDYKTHRESSSDFNFTIPVLELQFKEDFDIITRDLMNRHSERSIVDLRNLFLIDPSMQFTLSEKSLP